MAIYCIKCGTSLPDDAVFCMKCGKQLKDNSSASPSSTTKSGESQLYRIQVKNVFKTAVGEDEWTKEYGECTCTVTDRRLIFRTKKGNVYHVFLRDIDGVRSQSSGIIFRTLTVWLDGFGYIWCNFEGENDKLASAIKKAMLQM